LIIGDARGKGLGAIGDIATVLGAFRSDAHHRCSLSELATALERTVRWALAEDPHADTGEWPGERFVTAAVLEIPDDEPYARLVTFGHLPPLLLRDGTVVPVEVQDPAPPLGLGALSPTVNTVMTFPFAPGDRLLLYTDGVTETRDGRGTFYPLVERVAAWTDCSPDALVCKIREDLLAHAHGLLGDDMAILALQREESPARPRVRENPGTSPGKKSPLSA
jgi:serine phosphatase RsbU (regulator of sigma subunit)